MTTTGQETKTMTNTTNNDLSKLTMLPAWQRDVRERMSSEIISCISQLVSELMMSDQYHEDLMPVIYQQDWIQAAIDNGWEPDTDKQNEDAARDYCEEHNVEPYEIEALEHWLVSPWLADRLEEQGEMVLKDFLGLNIWGRATSGQSWAIDGVINRIYASHMVSDEALANYMTAARERS